MIYEVQKYQKYNNLIYYNQYLTFLVIDLVMPLTDKFSVGAYGRIYHKPNFFRSTFTLISIVDLVVWKT